MQLHNQMNESSVKFRITSHSKSSFVCACIPLCISIVTKGKKCQWDTLNEWFLTLPFGPDSAQAAPSDAQ